MAFTNEEIIKLAGSVLAAGTIDSNNNSNWYEKLEPNSFITDPASIWSDMAMLKTLPASNFTQAVANSVANDTLIGKVGINDDGTFDDATAIRLSPVAGTNNKSYVAYNTYGDPSDGVQRNWIQPQLIPRANGFPSAAYSPIIFSGLPSQGNMISTAAGNDGNWVSHFWNPAVGMLLISEADAPPSATFPSQDLYLCGFYYNGASGGGSFSGDNILLSDPDNMWRIRLDWPLLRFERREEQSDGTFVWNSYANMGHSIETDGITLSRPYDIKVDLNSHDMNHDESGGHDYRSVFSINGNNDFTFGNSQQQTVLETRRGEEVRRADTVLSGQELENRPLHDKLVVLDATDTAPADAITELTWVSNIDYFPLAEFIRFNELAFDVTTITDGEAFAPVRIAVEDLQGNLIQENVSVEGLNAGINGGFNFTTGYNFYTINPRYTDRRDATTIIRLTVARGHKVELTAGDYSNPNDMPNLQIVPRQSARVEYVNHVDMLDESNMKELIHRNTHNFLDGSIGAYYPEEDPSVYTPFAAPAEHTNTSQAVLGNYNSATYMATGDEGLHILFQDDATRTEFWTDADRNRITANDLPVDYKDVYSITLDLDGVFSQEMDAKGWDVVNMLNVLPLMRSLSDTPITYRATVRSNIDNGLTLQESQTHFAYLDGAVDPNHTLNPTQHTNPTYTQLQLPRTAFTVNRATPRTVEFLFPERVRIYGNYHQTTPWHRDFVPSIKATVIKVIEEPVVTGSDLEQRVDELQGQQEWLYAVQNTLPTLHEIPSDMWLAGVDGEPIYWADEGALINHNDQHQWLFSEGMEAYYQPTANDGIINGNTFTPNPLVVHLPQETVKSFEVSFGWDNTIISNNAIDRIEFEFFLATHGRQSDQQISIFIPRGASITYSFTSRRDGQYGYRATPYNDNLASTANNGLTEIAGIPVDPNPPIILN
ncbi:coil containing protein [Vibrio phage 1.121.O._10N.286.46.C4]|nr:coil containing protein [Vibrio phage 1.121.O._10N.286.46.C4]